MEWNVSAGLKQLKIAKWKVELKGKKKHEMCLRRFYFKKNQKNANPCVIGVQLQIGQLQDDDI